MTNGKKKHLFIYLSLSKTYCEVVTETTCLNNSYLNATEVNEKLYLQRYGNRILLSMVTLFFLILTSFNTQLFASNSDVTAFVTRFYQQCLSREPDIGGLEHWTNSLNNGAKAGDELAKSFVFSEEFQNQNTSDSEFVTILYKAFFNREPDTGGYNHWTNKILDGTSRASILEGFTSAQEFITLCESYGIKATLIRGGKSAADNKKKQINLSVGNNLTDLANMIREVNYKDDYETEVEYQQRMTTFAASLTGYYSTHAVSSEYDVETQTLYVSNPRNSFSDCSDRTTAFEDSKCTTAYIINTDRIPKIVTGTVHVDGYQFNSDSIWWYDFNDHYSYWVDAYDYETTEYAVIQVSADEAERIDSSFMVEYIYEFTAENIEETHLYCSGSWGLSNCSNKLDITLSEYRVYNTVTGLYY